MLGILIGYLDYKYKQVPLILILLHLSIVNIVFLARGLFSIFIMGIISVVIILVSNKEVCTPFGSVTDISYMLLTSIIAFNAGLSKYKWLCIIYILILLYWLLRDKKARFSMLTLYAPMISLCTLL